MMRRGFTLPELLVSLTLVGVLGAAVVGLLRGTQDAYRAESQQIDVRQNLRIAAALLPGELKELNAVDGDLVAMGAAALVILFIFSVYWGYFAFFEIIWKGQTPGKRLTGIRVIKDSGRPINVYEAIGRNLMRAVDWMPGMYIAGIVSMMISRQNRRLGDHVVGSVVVHDKRPEQIRPEWSSAPPQAASNPAISLITPEELVLIETYLQRRLDLDPTVRDATAYKIATRITARTKIERDPTQSLDDFLENIAKQVRDTARFR